MALAALGPPADMFKRRRSQAFISHPSKQIGSPPPLDSRWVDAGTASEASATTVPPTQRSTTRSTSNATDTADWMRPRLLSRRDFQPPFHSWMVAAAVSHGIVGVGTCREPSLSHCRPVTVAEVTYCNSISVSEHVVMMILSLVRNYIPSYQWVVERHRYPFLSVAQQNEAGGTVTLEKAAQIAPIPDGHSANQSLSTIEPVSAPPKWKLKNGE